MKNTKYRKLRTIMLLAGIMLLSPGVIFSQGTMQGEKEINLPPPTTTGGMSLTEALQKRHSVRAFQEKAITLKDVGQILWAGKGKRVDGVSTASLTAPSAGGLYPAELFLVAGKVEGLPDGVYSYEHRSHTLSLVKEGDVRSSLTRAALNQQPLRAAPLTVVIAALIERTTKKYGERGAERYVSMDAGHIAENIFLQVTALGLGTVTIGAFSDPDVKDVLGLSDTDLKPLYLMPVGQGK